MAINLLNKNYPLDKMESDEDIIRFVKPETIERAKQFAALLNPEIEYSTIPRVSGVITFEWTSLKSESKDVERLVRERVDVSEYGLDVHNKCIIATGNIGTHDIKFSI